MALRRVLVANRGEIAVRVMRACREEGMDCVAVFSPGEEEARHVRYADQAVELTSKNPLPYLDVDAVIRAAIESNADAIHPGYGFLAENAGLARRCHEAGIVFVGPPPEAISTMGDKVRARAAAEAAGVPIVPGSDGEVDLTLARSFAKEIGYPIALKASAGGGGRGFRVVRSDGELERGLEAARGEAERYFGDPTVYAEKYLDQPRHIEIQLMADSHGNVVGLGERDCSIQRRHQKLVEEAPSPVLDAETRAAMNRTAELLARAVDYVSAGTVEFLYSNGDFYFLEMNTRIQVEHPVTEEITGIDLVREQLRVASGEPLSFDAMPRLHGHAIECRVNAEDPARDFSPTPGKLRRYAPPSGFGVRVDTGYVEGDAIDPRFDNLVAKLIVWGRDRDEALSRLHRALTDFEVAGVASTIPLFQTLIRRPDFRAGDYDTGYLERLDIVSSLAPFVPDADQDDDDQPGIPVVIDGQTYRVELPEALITGSGGLPSAPRRERSARKPRGSAAPTGNELKSPIQGTVLSVAVEDGAEVELGDLICVVEAMKMENELTAHRNGRVTSLAVQAGETVKPGDVITRIEDV